MTQPPPERPHPTPSRPAPDRADRPVAAAPTEADPTTADVAIVGAGIVGAAIAAFLAPSRRVLLLEGESAPGMHTTGRSAALYAPSYGPPAVRALTRASRAFFDAPPPGFAAVPLLRPRGALMVAGPDRVEAVDALLATLRAEGGRARRLDGDAALRLVPVLRPEACAAAVLDDDAFDIDVDALLQGFLRRARAAGARLVTDARIAALDRVDGAWRIATADGRRFGAAVVVNAAGAWADALASLAGAGPAGIEPRRRSAFVFDPPVGVESAAWPAVIDIDETWYVKPDAGLLLGSPANADPVPPHDVVAEELDVATGIHRIETATTLVIRRPRRTWAGLRCFAPDGEPVLGFDPAVPGFFWAAGVGGYGIQSAPAVGRLCAAWLGGEAMPPDLAAEGLDPTSVRPRHGDAPALRATPAPADSAPAPAPRGWLAMRLHAPHQPLRAERTADLPEPGPGQVRLAVSACGVCRTDLHLVDGELAHPGRPVVPGHEIVGRVTALGSGVSDLAIGDRVGVPWLGWTCGRCAHCLAGRENLCPDARFTGWTIDGGYAEQAVADARHVFRLPDRYDDLEAAPLLCAGLIGWRSYVKAGTGPGDRLGIYGFGAAAHLIAQVAVMEGRSVFAFTRPGDADAQALARETGAAWTGGSDEVPPEPLDAAIVFAPVGALVPAALAAVRPGGTVVCGGIHMSDIPSFPYRLLWGERRLLSVAHLTRADALDFLAVAARLPLRVQARPYRLLDAQRALDDLRAGRVHGAAVLRPD